MSSYRNVNVMFENAPEVGANLTTVLSAAACRRAAAHLRSLSHDVSGVRRMVFVCRAVEFDWLAAQAEGEERATTAP